MRRASTGGRAYVCAQFFQARNLGIRGSFINTTREADAGTADAAIRLALQPQVSSALLRPNPNPYGGHVRRSGCLALLSPSL